MGASPGWFCIRAAKTCPPLACPRRSWLIGLPFCTISIAVTPERPLKSIRTILTAVVALTTIAAAHPSAAKPKPAVRFAVVHGRKIAYVTMGQGGPPIVFISGFGDGIDNSRQVAEMLARHSTVLIFDRAGYGNSDPSDAPRDGEEISSQLEGVIDAAGFSGPVILIGHSAGGEYGEYYAQRYPDRVAGLVLDEARPIDFLQRCLTNVPRKTCITSPRLIRLLPRAMQLENASFEKLAADIGAHPNYPGPVMIMASGIATEDGVPFHEQWTKAQAATATRYGTVVLTSPTGGHYLHRDDPVWFEQNVSTFLERIRASPPNTPPH